MPTRLTYPTPYPDVNALSDRLLSGVQAALGDNFIGMYLHGSLANGDFDPDRSDIDFLAVTRDALSTEMVSALKELHARIAASDLRWKTNVEGSYIPLKAIRRYDPTNSVHPAVRVDGNFGLDPHGSDWVIQRYIIREKDIVVAGPSIDPISADDLRQAQARTLEEWWAPQLDNPFRLRSTEYQAYAVLTMCRALYTLEFGTIASKPKAAGWAQQALGERWRSLIDRALAWRHGVELDCLEEALAFIRYTMERSRHHLAS